MSKPSLVARMMPSPSTSSSGRIFAKCVKINAEITEFAPAEVIGLHEKSKADSQELSESVSLLIQRRVAAEQAFSAIAGQANGAIAEAKRQEALATMGEVAEQYLEVAMASKLLKWAIDRYRDKKQGPMLLRAGAVFATLTLGVCRIKREIKLESRSNNANA